MADSVVLEEEIDPDYEPTESEVIEYANWLGMDLENDKDILWIAREGLKAPLPENWKPCKTTDTNEVYYFNFSTGESKWEHPCDEFYRNLYEEEKKRKMQRDGLGKGGKKAKEERRRKKKEKKEILEIVGKQRNRAPDKEDLDQLRSLIAEAPTLEAATLNRKGSSSLSLKPLPSLSNSSFGKKPLPGIRPTTAPVLQSNQQKPVQSEELRPKSSRSSRREISLEEESKASDGSSLATAKLERDNSTGASLDATYASFKDGGATGIVADRPEDEILEETEKHHSKLAELRRKHKLDREALEIDFKEELYQLKTINKDKIKREYERTRQRCLEEAEDKERALRRENQEHLEFLEAEMEEEYQRRSEELRKKAEEDMADLKQRLEEKQHVKLERLEETYASTLAEAKKFLSKAEAKRVALSEERESLDADSQRQRAAEVEQRERWDERQRELDERENRLKREKDELATTRLDLGRKLKEFERKERESLECIAKMEDANNTVDNTDRIRETEREYEEQIKCLKAERDVAKVDLDAAKEEISSYKKKVVDYDFEIERLSTELSTTQRHLSENRDDKSSSSENQFLVTKLKELEAKMKETGELHRKDLEELLQNSEEKDKRIRRFEARMREMDALLEEERNSSSLKLDPDSAAQTEKLLGELRAARSNVGKYKAEFDRAEKESQEARSRAAEAARISDGLTSRWTAEQNQHANALAKLNILERDNSVLKAQLAGYKDRIPQKHKDAVHEEAAQASLLKEELDSSEREIEFLHAAVDNLKDTLARKDEELGFCMKPEEARELEMEMHKARTKQAHNGVKLADLEKQNETLRAHVEELESSKEVLVQRLAAGAKAEQLLRDRIVAIESEAYAKPSATNHLGNLNAFSCQGCTDADKIRTELTLSKQKLTDSGLLIEELKASVKGLEGRLTEGIKSRTELEAALRQRLQVAEYSLEQETQKSCHLNKKIEALKQTKQVIVPNDTPSDTGDEVKDLETRLKKSRAEAFNVGQRLKEAEVEKFELDLQLSKIQKERKLLLDDLEESCKKNSQLTAKIELVQQQSAAKAEVMVNEKLQALGAYEKRVLQERSEVATLEAKEMKLRGINEQLRNRLDSIERSYAESTQRITELASQQKSSQAIINKLEIERDSLKRGLAAAVLRVEEITIGQTPETTTVDPFAPPGCATALVKQDTAPAKENLVDNGTRGVPAEGPQLEYLLNWARERSNLVDELNRAAAALKSARSSKAVDATEKLCGRVRTLHVALDEQINGLYRESNSRIEVKERLLATEDATPDIKRPSNGHVVEGLVPSSSASSPLHTASRKARLKSSSVWEKSNPERGHQAKEVQRFAQSHSDWLLKFRSNILMDLREASVSVKPIQLEPNPSRSRTARDLKKRRKKSQRRARRVLRETDKLLR